MAAVAITQPLTPNVKTGGLPAIAFPSAVNHRTVTTAEDETVPALAFYMVVSSDADIWLANGTGAAVVPSSDVVDGSGSLFIAKGVISPPFLVQPGQKISVVSAAGTAHPSFWYYGKGL